MKGSSAKPRRRADLRTVAVNVVRTLTEAGFVAYFAGGCVRDRLMGLVPTDYDVATDARPDAVGELFKRAQHVGESFGVMLVSVRCHHIQVATFRTEGVYSDSRHPDTVTFSDAEHDATRRDFTINGLFEDPLTGEVIDFVGGWADLKAKLIRAIGDPQARLREDRLRLLRAVRFAARFDFTIEPATREAIRCGAAELTGVSRERIGQEIKRMLTHRNRAVAGAELQALGLDEPVLQEPHQEVPLKRLGAIADDSSFPAALAAWMLDRHGTEIDLRKRVRGWTATLTLSNAEQLGLRHTLEIFEALGGEWPRSGVAEQKRLAARPEFEQSLQLLEATDARAGTRIRHRVGELAETDLSPAPLINGHDLIALGLDPGPVFKHVLDEVYDAQLEGRVVDRQAALALARRAVDDPGPGS